MGCVDQSQLASVGVREADIPIARKCFSKSYPQCTRGHTAGKEPIFIPAALLAVSYTLLAQYTGLPCSSVSTTFSAVLR